MKFPSKEELKKTITLRRAFFELTKDINSGIFISQLHYWSLKTKDPEGWIYKTQEQWQEEIYLSPYQQRQVRKRLKELDLIEEKQAGIPRKLFFRIKYKPRSEVSQEHMEDFIHRQPEETLTKEVKKLNVNSIETSHHTYIEESTTKITSKNTTNDVVSVAVEPCIKTSEMVIFEHWKQTMEHPSAKLDGKRTKLIQGALKLGYSSEDLCSAISGCSVTPHNIGENDKGQRYDGLNIILRDADQIDRFINNYHNPPKLRSASEKRTLKNIDVAQQWLSKNDAERSNGRQ